MADKVQILGSPLGMYSLLRDDYIISVLRDDGSLDEEKLNRLAARIANMGANGLRDFYWIDTRDAYEKISPFWHEGELSFTFNQQFFQNQRKIAETCNRYNMRYYFCLFDHCGTKREVGEWNPWRFFSDFFYGNDARELRHQYIDRVVEAFAGLDAGTEICNEPDSGKGEFLADTFIYLFKKGFNPWKFILGLDYHLKEKHGATYGSDYREFREQIVSEVGVDWRQGIKDVCISPVHNATVDNIEELWGTEVGPGGTRRILYSMDGVQNPRPDKDTMHQITRKVLEMKTEAREKEKIHFEVVFGKTARDPLDSIEGVAEGYKEVWGEYPGNYGKYPAPLYSDTADPTYRVWVAHGYRGLLGREPDSAGMEDYSNFLEEGGTIQEFCQKLCASDEFETKSAKLSPSQQAYQLYRGILDREPDSDGLTHTIAEIVNQRVVERAVAMLESQEFKRKFF